MKVKNTRSSIKPYHLVSGRRKTKKATFKRLSIFFILSLFVMMNIQIAQARLIFVTNDAAFQNANIVALDATQGFAAGVQQVQLTSGNVNFDFTTLSSNGLSDVRGTLISYFPEGVTVTFSQAIQAIGFQFQLAECQGNIRFIGSLATEEHTFQFGQGNIFVGAADIGDITAVELNGTCVFAIWPEMRFAVAAVNPPPNQQADLRFSKNAPLIASQLDGTIDFDLNVVNTGPDSAIGTQIVDFPPGGMQVVASNPSFPLVSQNNRVVVMGVGDMLNNDQFTNTLTMQVPPFIGSGPIGPNSGNFQCNSSLLNVALATSSSIDPDASNNSALTVTRFDNTSRINLPEICDNAIDDNCDGRVDCGDNACANAPNCRPPQLLNANNNPPQSCFQANNAIVCLNNGGPVPFPIGPGIVPTPPAPQACVLRNIHGATREAPACCCSYGPCDRAYCDSLLPKDPNFKTVNPPVSSQGYGITQAGRRHDYQITYENIGEADATDVQIYDVLALELDDSTLQINNNGEYDPDTRVIVWRDPLLPPAEPRSVSFSINVREDAQPGDRIRNQATIIFPTAEQARTDTNWVEHAIEDPAFPATADLGIVDCIQAGQDSDEWTVVLFNKGTAFAHNVSAEIINPPFGIDVINGNARFGRSDDTEPALIGTAVPLGSTHSIEPIRFTSITSASVCKALNWRISYTSSEGELISTEVRAAADADLDGVADIDDNCPSTANIEQQDADGNGVGDACEVPVPTVCGDLDADFDVDNNDRILFMSALRTTSADPSFIPDADLDQDQDVDFSDYQAWYRCYRNYLAQAN